MLEVEKYCKLCFVKKSKMKKKMKKKNVTLTGIFSINCIFSILIQLLSGIVLRD